MKRRHLLVGFSIVLAISLAVPALGAGGLAGIRALAKKALTAATGAQNTASNAQKAAGDAGDAARTAQKTAGDAGDAARTAQGTASTALNKANAAEAAAVAAQGKANTAQAVANAAKDAADTAGASASSASATASSASTAANAASTTANAASTAVAAKFGHVFVTDPVTAVAKGQNAKEALVTCPAGTILVSGGYEFTSNTAEVHYDQPLPAAGDTHRSSTWKVQAQSEGDPFDFKAYALCLEP